MGKIVLDYWYIPDLNADHYSKILINEMSLEPFNKHNCVAMLNTLYPPVATSQPTKLLTAVILKRQRDGFSDISKWLRRVDQAFSRPLWNKGSLK